MTKDEIYRERLRLDRLRIDYRTKVMEEFDKTHREKLKAIQSACEKIGHEWKFDTLNWLGTVAIYRCVRCNKSKDEDI